MCIETTSNTPSNALEGLGSYAGNRTLAISSVGSSDLNRCLLSPQGTHRFLKKDKSVEILTNNSFKTQVHVPSLPFTICHLEPVNFMTQPQFPHLHTGDDKISWAYEN